MITTEKEYEEIVTRLEELLKNPENIENSESEGFEELNRLSDLVVDYEEKNYPIQSDNVLSDPANVKRLEKSIQSYQEGKTIKLSDEELKKLLGI